MSKEEEGKLVDSRCHKLTASFVRRSHQRDKNVPVCLFFEVNMSYSICVGSQCLSIIYYYVSLFRNLMKRVGKSQYHQEYTTWYVEVHVLDIVNRILVTVSH